MGGRYTGSIPPSTYAMSGTDVGYAASTPIQTVREVVNGQVGDPLLCYATSGTDLGYAVSGTDLGSAGTRRLCYAVAMRCRVLTSGLPALGGVARDVDAGARP
eukprot:439946-Rhodomonas_salina.1